MRLKQSSCACLIIESRVRSADTTRPGVRSVSKCGWKSRCADITSVRAGLKQRHALITSCLSHKHLICDWSGQTSKPCVTHATHARRVLRCSGNSGVSSLRMAWRFYPTIGMAFLRKGGGMPKYGFPWGHRSWKRLRVCQSIFKVESAIFCHFAFAGR